MGEYRRRGDAETDFDERSMSVSGDRHILFIAYHFPPAPAVACVRTFSIAKYLRRAGWHVTVLTLEPSLWGMPAEDERRVGEEVANLGIDRLLAGQRLGWLVSGHSCKVMRGPKRVVRGVARRLAYSCGVGTLSDWCSEAERVGERLRAGTYDAVLATGGPFQAFGVAARLARSFGCPYVLDYRDLWAGNPHDERLSDETQEDEEGQLLRRAAAVTVVSQSMAEFLATRFRLRAQPTIIPNGFDPDELRDVGKKEFGHFAIVYAGSFYVPKSTARPMMAAIRRLRELDGSCAWRFHYYGTGEAHVRKTAREFDVEDRVEVHGIVPRARVLSAIRGAGAAMVVVSDHDVGDDADRGIVTGKVFEPIGLGTPVLVVAPAGSDVREIISTSGNGAAFVGSDVEGMAEYLAGLVKGHQIPPGRPDLWSWPKVIEGMDAVLRAAAEQRAWHGESDGPTS